MKILQKIKEFFIATSDENDGYEFALKALRDKTYTAEELIDKSDPMGLGTTSFDKGIRRALNDWGNDPEFTNEY